MTAATYTSNLVDIFLFESATGVSAYGGGAAGLTAEPDFAMEGTNAVDKQITGSADKGFLFAAGAAFTINDYDHFYEWIYAATFGILDSRDNNGISVGIGDDVSNFVKFHVDGNDTLPVGSGGTPYCIRFVNTGLTNFRTLVGTPGTTPDNIGGGLNVTGNSKDINLGIDAARIGSGYIITGGTGADDPADFAGIATNDESTQEGIFQNTTGGFNQQGKIHLGTSAAEGELTDSNKNIFILDGLHHAEDHTEILVRHPSSILTLTNVNFITIAGKQQTVAGNNPNRGRFEMLTPLIDAQDETSYDNSPTTEGTFAGGTGHAATDVLVMSDDSEVVVDAVSGGVVTEFTVQSSVAPTATIPGVEARSAVAGTTITQVSSDGAGIDFSLTPDTDNIRPTPTCALTGVSFIGIGKTVLLSGGTFSGCRWVGSDIIEAGDADLTGSTIDNFDDQIIIDAQDETLYNNSPTTEGTFAGGTGHANTDILTMSDGSLITVDLVSGGVVTQFTVDSSTAVASITGVANTQLVSDGSGINFTLTPDLDNLAEVAALQWLENTDPDGFLDDMTFLKGTNPTHAIEFGITSPLTMTVRGFTNTGYNASNAAKDSFFWVRRTSGTVTINVIGGSGNFSYKSDGATVVIVVDPVTIRIEGLTEGSAAVMIAAETVGTITAGDVLLSGLADSTGAIEDAGFDYEGAFGAGLDVTVRARNSGFPSAAIADDNTVLTDETTEANSNVTGDMTLMPLVPVATEDRYIFGHNEEFGQLKLDISVAGVGTVTPVITWQYWNGAWTNLSGVTDGTDSFQNSGENTVSWTIPGDWADTTINSQGPFKFVRASLASGNYTTTEPVGRKCKLDVARYIPFEPTSTFVVSSTGLTVVAAWARDNISSF